MIAASTALAVRPPAYKPKRLRDPITPPPVVTDEQDDEIGGLDLALAPTRDEQLALLNAALGDPVAYGRQFLICIAQIGVVLTVNRRGGLISAFPGDGVIRERQGRLAPLSEHMRMANMRNAVAGAVHRHGCYTDRRPNDPRQTTRVLRDFLNAGYRLYSTPGNWVEEGGTMPLEWFKTEDQDRADEIIRAGRAYLQLRARFAAREQIDRVVRMLGKRNEHGYTVLERRA